MQTVGSISKVVEGVSAKEVFAIWADVNNWHRFNHGIKYARLDGEFVVGSGIVLGLLEGREVSLILTEVTIDKSFTDVTKFPLAKMYGIHDIVEKNGKITLTTTIKIDGVLSFLWKKLVAQKVADKMEDDLNSLIELVKNGKKE